MPRIKGSSESRIPFVRSFPECARFPFAAWSTTLPGLNETVLEEPVVVLEVSRTGEQAVLSDLCMARAVEKVNKNVLCL